MDEETLIDKTVEIAGEAVSKIDFASLTMEQQLEEGIKIATSLAKAQFDPDDDELPCGLALANVDSKTGKQFDEPSVICLMFDPAFLETKEMKVKLVSMIKQFTKDSDCAFMIFMCRAWMAHATNKSDIPNDLSTHANKKEAKMMIIDHRSLGHKMMLAPIEKNSEGVLALGEFGLVDDVEGNMIGAFFDRKSN